MPYKEGELIVHLPVYIQKESAREILLGTIPKGCRPAEMVSQERSATDIIYHLRVATGEENAWQAHLRVKVRKIFTYRVERQERPAMHRRPRFH